MTYLKEEIDASRKCCFVSGNSTHGVTLEEKQWLNKNSKGVNVIYGNTNQLLGEKEAFDVCIVSEAVSLTKDGKFWGAIFNCLKNGGKLYVNFPLGVITQEEIKTRLLLGGFINQVISAEGNSLQVTAERPHWKGVSLVSNNKRKQKQDSPIQVVDLIDEDALLNENDDCTGNNVKIELNDLGVITTQKKKVACKNCSCGLADAITTSTTKNENKQEEGPTATSGCGSCAKGDAFRCGGCPYLGLPAFTPGTKPEIKVNSDGSKVLIDLGNDF